MLAIDMPSPTLLMIACSSAVWTVATPLVRVCKLVNNYNYSFQACNISLHIVKCFLSIDDKCIQADNCMHAVIPVILEIQLDTLVKYRYSK